MLTVMCPNCRHRFPAPGCCEPADGLQNENKRNSSNDMVHPSGCYYGGGLLVPRGYTSGGGCFINAPTIVHGPAIIQTGGQQCSTNTIGNVDPSKYLQRVQRETRKSAESRDTYGAPSECHVATTCDLTGGTVTITTPSIQSGGCLIQSTDSGILVQAPQIEIRPKLSGGGCLVQKRVAEQDVGSVLANEEDCSESKYADEPMNSCCNVVKSHGHRKLFLPPSGCQELPGTRRNLVRNSNAPSGEHHLMQDVAELNDFVNEDEEPRYGFEATSSPDVQVRTRMFARDETERQNEQNQQQQQLHGHSDSCQDPIFRPQSRKSCCCSNTSNLSQGQARPASHSGIPNVNSANNLSENTFSKCLDNRDSLQIQVNATVQLPASLGQCTVNITATTANNLSSAPNTRARNNFNGGGLVESAPTSNHVVNANERRDGAPTTPVSWLMPCPWSFDTFFVGKEMATLCEVKRLLQICGWYHEGLSWQQSESLLKNAPVGRWLMRDSSDSRYTFAVSVQTARGPTSVRVHHFLGKFRLDAEPRLALAMPMFDCPIKMLEHYVEYSKRMDEHRREVWVDYSGQLYSQIYLTKPLVKEVRSLSHLARLAVNRNKLPTDQLPPLIKDYLADYPYTL